MVLSTFWQLCNVGNLSLQCSIRPPSYFNNTGGNSKGITTSILPLKMAVSFLYCATNIIIKPTPLWPLWYSLPAHSTASPSRFTVHSHSCLMHIAHCTTIILYLVWLTCSLYSVSARSSASPAHCPGTPARWTARSVLLYNLTVTFSIPALSAHCTVGSSDLQQISQNQVASCGGKLMKGQRMKIYWEKKFFPSMVSILFWCRLLWNAFFLRNVKF